MASKEERGGSDALTSPIYEYARNSDMRAAEFYHPAVGFGRLREYAPDLDEICVIASLYDEEVPELLVSNFEARCEFDSEAEAVRIVAPVVLMFKALRHAVKISSRPQNLIAARLPVIIDDSYNPVVVPDLSPKEYGLRGDV
jgi:hypothetical protein